VLSFQLTLLGISLVLRQSAPLSVCMLASRVTGSSVCVCVEALVPGKVLQVGENVLDLD